MLALVPFLFLNEGEMLIGWARACIPAPEAVPLAALPGTVLESGQGCEDHGFVR